MKKPLCIETSRPRQDIRVCATSRPEVILPSLPGGVHFPAENRAEELLRKIHDLGATLLLLAHRLSQGRTH